MSNTSLADENLYDENGVVQLIQLKKLVVLLLLGVTNVMLSCPAQHALNAPKSVAVVPPFEVRADINHASVDELMKVPGLTRSWAGRIVRFRPYYTKQDLLDRGIVNSQVYDRIRKYVIAHHSEQ